MVKEEKMKSVPFGGGYEKAKAESKKLFNLIPHSKGGKMIKKDIVKSVPFSGK